MKADDIKTVEAEADTFLGTIKRSGIAKGEMQAFDASLLPVGTKLYQISHTTSEFWILAKYGSWAGVYIENPFASKQENHYLSESTASSEKSTTNDWDSLPVSELQACFVYDTNNIQEAVGISDYVFVGKVLSCDGTEYRDVVTVQDENGNPKSVGTPYTTYTVEVIKNMKGELVTSQPIQLTKEGGVSENQDKVVVFENDELPKTDNVYIFLAYAQRDGSLLVSGPNSNRLLETAETYDATASLSPEEEAYQEAVENEIIPIERERSVSTYDVNRA